MNVPIDGVGCRHFHHISRANGPKTRSADAELTVLIHEVIKPSPWLGEGYRKVWAQLGFGGIGICKRRVLRLMRLANLLTPSRSLKVGH
jgi:hypothetical protein